MEMKFWKNNELDDATIIKALNQAVKDYEDGAIAEVRDSLAEHHIKNVASDSYTLDWNTKTITITAYAETKQESSLISSYIKNSPNKFKRLVQK